MEHVSVRTRPSGSLSAGRIGHIVRSVPGPNVLQKAVGYRRTTEVQRAGSIQVRKPVLRKNSIWVIWTEYEHESHGIMAA